MGLAALGPRVAALLVLPHVERLQTRLQARLQAMPGSLSSLCCTGSLLSMHHHAPGQSCCAVAQAGWDRPPQLRTWVDFAHRCRCRASTCQACRVHSSIHTGQPPPDCRGLTRPDSRAGVQAVLDPEPGQPVQPPEARLDASWLSAALRSLACSACFSRCSFQPWCGLQTSYQGCCWCGPARQLLHDGCSGLSLQRPRCSLGKP